jgi:organic hydroperoxide reductase OsmC/OhrA
VTSYQDEAVGFLEQDGGKLWIARVILRPQVEINTDAETLRQIHHMAHEACFIANSVRTEITVEPR